MEALQEAYPEAAAILRDAGWTPHDTWGVYTRWTLVMGSPSPGEFYVKDWGKDVHGPDTPDDPVEAAEWLVAKLSKAQLSTEASLDIPLVQIGEGEETLAYEGDGETGEEAAAGPRDGQSGGDGELLGAETALVAGETSPGPEDAIWAEHSEVDRGSDVTDDSHISSVREQLEAEALPDFTAEMYEAEAEAQTPQPQDRVYGLDDLDRRRKIAIERVWQHALAIMPEWAAEDDTRLVELRNFAMGVSEGRWPFDRSKEDALQIHEATLSRVRAIEGATMERVRFLNEASREEVEGFDPEAGWPA